MPAASDAGAGSAPPVPPLPRTYRPLGPRIAGLVAMAALLAVGAGAWFTFDDATRASFTTFQRGTVIALTLLALATIYSLVRSRVRADEQGLLVVNGYRRHRLAWEQVVGIHLAPGSPWVTLDVSDGRTVSVMAIQGSDGARSRRAVRELRAIIDR